MPHSSAAIELRSVARLLTDEAGNQARYWIPSYQRGYRWNKNQVTQLLDDIRDFVKDSKASDGKQFYCLQPLVVKKMDDGRYEVVDGQQRLTTIHVILSNLKAWVSELGHVGFQIDFDTRRDPDFLRNIDLSKAEENVDFYHICQAWEAVEEWKKGNGGNQVLSVLQHLLNGDDDIGNNVRVIWYELTSNDDAVAAFTRLNVGKIPLTESELIRALFLRRAAADDESGELAMRIAYQWDRIEHSLQDDAFWYFLQSSGATTNRITLIFNLASEMRNRRDDGDEHRAFTYFADALKQRGTTEQVWKKVNDIFQALEEWYEDRYLYHVIGFILHHTPRSDQEIGALLADSRKLFKRDFRASLRDRVLRLIFDADPMTDEEIATLVDEECREVSYKNPDRVRKLLLLFNIATLLDNRKSNIRFQFDSFKNESWDVEHIRSVSAERPDDTRAQRAWLEHCSAYLASDPSDEATALANAIAIYLNDDGGRTDEISFDTIDGQILAYFKEAGEGGGNGLSNLTLLDSRTNRGYKNSVFAVKRKILLENDQAGTFVPLCTRNVFLKCYSHKVGNVTFWSRSDADDYLTAISETISNFLKSAELA